MAESEFGDWLVSVDDHVIEPPNVWRDRLPAKHRDAGPTMVRDGSGEYWTFEQRKIPTPGLFAVVGKSAEEFSPEPITYAEMRPGCYDPRERLADMDRAGILASMAFPSLPRFCGQLFWEAQDKELGLLCVRAYNDWMIDEWCATAPDRYIPLIIIPLWDPALAVREMERCAAKGVHAFTFSENFEPLELPTIHDAGRYWDPVLAAANDLEMVVCMHVGSSSTLPAICRDAPFMANLAWGASRTAGTLLSWLFSGHFQRHPKLKIALSEGNVGWIPYFLERAQQVYDTQRYWVERGVDISSGEGYGVGSAEMPALGDVDLHQVYLEHVYGCFIDDIYGLNNVTVLGEDNIMIETDYPHSDSTWPDSLSLARKRVAHLTPALQRKILRANAERLFQFSASR